MRVGSVSSAYAPKLINKNQKQNTAFKADVRIVENQFDSSQMPTVYQKRMNDALNHLLTSLQNKGDDNMLILLRPVVNGETSKKKMKADIEISHGFKDPEKARRNILENLKNPEFIKKHLSYDEPEKIKRDIKLLEQRDPGVMSYLSSMSGSSGQSVASHYIFTEVPPKKYNEYIDKMIDYLPRSMSYNVYKDNDVLDVGDVNKKIPLWEKIKNNYPKPSPGDLIGP